MSDYQESDKAAEGSQPAQDDRVSLMDIAHVLVKHRGLILGSSITALVFIVVFSVITALLPQELKNNPMPNLYKSKVRVLLTWVEMQSKWDSLGYNLGISPAMFFNPAIVSPYLELINGILYGNAALDQIADEFDLYDWYGIVNTKREQEAAREKLKKAITIDQVTSSRTPFFYILEIGFISKDPSLAVKIATRSVKLLEERFRKITMEQILGREEFIEQRVQLVEQRIADAKNAIFSFQQTYGTIDLATQSREQNRLISELRSEIIRKELELSNLSKYARPNDARVVRLRDEIERKTQLISELKAGSSHGFVALEKIPQLQMELQELERDLKTQEELYFVLKKEYETVKIEESNNLNNFQIIEAATIPEVPYGPRRKIVCVLVTLSVFLLSVFWAFFKEYVESLRRMPGESEKLNSIKQMLTLRKRKEAAAE